MFSLLFRYIHICNPHLAVQLLYTHWFIHCHDVNVLKRKQFSYEFLRRFVRLLRRLAGKSSQKFPEIQGCRIMRKIEIIWISKIDRSRRVTHTDFYSNRTQTCTKVICVVFFIVTSQKTHCRYCRLFSTECTKLRFHKGSLNFSVRPHFRWAIDFWNRISQNQDDQHPKCRFAYTRTHV